MSNSTGFSSYSNKLWFFVRVRRFLQKKSSCKSHDQSRDRKGRAGEELAMGRQAGKHQESSSVMLQRSVKKLHFGDGEEKETAVEEIIRLAAEDLLTRKSLASLGVIPTLVSILDSPVPGFRLSAVRALVELSNGTQTNKLLMVEAGIMGKLSQLVRNGEESRTGDVVFLLLSLSSLIASAAHISFPTSYIIPFLMDTLESDVIISEETKLACLDILYNFSTVLDHTSALVSCTGLVQTLIRFSSRKNGTSEKALATLGNLVVSMSGKQAVETHPSVPVIFIEILTWDEKPKCQEVAAYILMIIAHGSSAQREKMARSGIVPVLLEVALLGSALAQKRALKILQWFKDERQMKMGAHSGPQSGRVPALTCSPVNQKQTQEGRRAIKMMVKQSLDKNMESIMRRANASQDPSKLKGLMVSTSSKSLPY